jgi:hypothetical protein
LAQRLQAVRVCASSSEAWELPLNAARKQHCQRPSSRGGFPWVSCPKCTHTHRTRTPTTRGPVNLALSDSIVVPPQAALQSGQRQTGCGTATSWRIYTYMHALCGHAIRCRNDEEVSPASEIHLIRLLGPLVFRLNAGMKKPVGKNAEACMFDSFGWLRHFMSDRFPGISK